MNSLVPVTIMMSVMFMMSMTPVVYTVATEKSICQECMEVTLFHPDLWGIFWQNMFQEADNSPSTSPIRFHVIFPMYICTALKLGKGIIHKA
jgi:hypothetical protein